MTNQEQKKLGQTLWNIADQLRGAMQTIADQGAQVAQGLAPVAHIVLDQDARNTVTPERREQHPGQAPAFLENKIEGIGRLGGESP